MSRVVPAVPEPAPAEPRAPESETARTVLRTLRRSKGRATVGDVVADAGLPADRAEAALRELLESRRGHLEVGERGDLVFAFDPRLIRRDHVPLLTRFREAVTGLLVRAFKVWIMLMLVVYFLVFVALVIGAFLALIARGGDDRRSHRHVHLPLHWILYLFWSPGWGRGRPYYGHRFPHPGGTVPGRSLPRGGPFGQRKPGKDENRVPFYKKVFAFVFGPDAPEPTQRQKDRSVLRLIRARRGVLTTPELVQHTGLPLPRAEEEMARITAGYGGEPRVSPGGELVYAFPDLMVSAEGRVAAREPDPAWRRLETPRPLTGNERKTDLLVGGLNGFNLLVAATAPAWIFPSLGIGGPWAWTGLVLIPVIFSLLLFAVPLGRKVLLDRENERRRRRNVRKVLLGRIYADALRSAGPVTLEEAEAHVRSVLDDRTVPREWIETALHELAAEFEADATPDASGRTAFSFPQVRRAFLAAEEVREGLRLEEGEVGQIVYSSADTPEEAGERDLEAFDRELAGYAGAPERIGYMDELELLAFDEALARERES